MEKYRPWSREKFAGSELTRQHLLFNLDSVDFEELKRIIEFEWDDPDVFAGIQTIFAGLYTLSEDLLAPIVYRHFLKTIQFLGSGVEAVVIGSGLREKETLFALKSPQFQVDYNLEEKISQAISRKKDLLEVNGDIYNLSNPKEILESLNSRYYRKGAELLQREFLIGWELTKFHLPIFYQTYGIFDCSGPVLERRNIQTFCSNTLPNTIANQYIPGRKLLQVIPDMNVREFLLTLLILVGGLEEAFEKAEFTHYDLHINNIIIRNLPETWVFPVRQYWISSKNLPIIIDFGFSRLRMKDGTVLYREGFEKYKIGSAANPLYDIYKIIFECLETSGVLFQQIKFLASFFYPKLTITPDFVRRKRTKTEGNSLFVLPDQFADQTIQDFLNWLFLQSRSFRPFGRDSTNRFT